MDHFTEYGSDSDSSPDVSNSAQASAPSGSALSSGSVSSAPNAASVEGSHGNNASAAAAATIATGIDDKAAVGEAGPASSLANPQVQEKIKKFLDSMSTENGNMKVPTFTDKLKQQKEFRNPYWLAKVIGHFGINDVRLVCGFALKFTLLSHAAGSMLRFQILFRCASLRKCSHRCQTCH